MTSAKSLKLQKNTMDVTTEALKSATATGQISKNEPLEGSYKPEPFGCYPRAAVGFGIVFLAAALINRYVNASSLLVINWLYSAMTASALWMMILWVIPKWFPNVNCYLWCASRPASLRRSVSVALLSFFLALIVILGLIVLGRIWQPGMTDHWPELWAIVICASIIPIIILLVIGILISGAADRFRWLDPSQLIVGHARGDFNDFGRFFIIFVAGISIAMIQAGIVLTGGLSVSFFSVLLVSVSSVAALASEKPAYAIITVILGLAAAIFTELIGSYEPPARTYYPVAHLTMFTLTLVIGLLIDLGRKLQPEPQTRDAGV